MRKRGIATSADLKANSRVDVIGPPQWERGCWHYLGSLSTDNVPRIWAFDHARGEKHSLSGPKAVWNISRGRGPTGLAYRTCASSDCVNPHHHAEAPDRVEIGRVIAIQGRRKGTATAQRRANLALAREAAGIKTTPVQIIAAIQSAPKTIRNVELAALHGVSESVVSNWRQRAA